VDDQPEDARVPRPRATLYRLIEAGQRAHRALVAPLLDRGLEPGDDAVLFLIGETNGTTGELLAQETGLADGLLEARIDRLVARELVCRRAIGPELVPGLALTERGERVRQALAGTWNALDEALLGELDRKERKRLDRALKHLLRLLRW
jgi:DNA-binding MarR family transcriptional regulator